MAIPLIFSAIRRSLYALYNLHLKAIEVPLAVCPMRRASGTVISCTKYENWQHVESAAARRGTEAPRPDEVHQL